DKHSDSIGAGRLFSYLNPKKDQFALNIAQISAKIKYENILRSNITFQFGDLPTMAWTNLGAKYPMIQQANAGVQLFQNCWLDAGFFLTHIGGEALLPKDNWLSTHSLLTFYEPYFQAGVKVGYETDKFTACLHILNGNGIFDENNNNKTLGLYLSYTPSGLYSLSYGGVIGNEEPGDPVKAKVHMLNNFVGQINPTDNLSIKAQFDYGTKDVENPNESLETKNGKFIGYSLTGHYQFNKQYSSTIRIDYADNADGIYLPAVKGLDLSLGAEYKPTDNSYIRIEGRMLQFDDKFKLFWDGTSYTKSRMELILNMGVWIN
ncbi:MAG: outer membrane beta-barrel protein, partial [FCB group bacterium]